MDSSDNNLFQQLFNWDPNASQGSNVADSAQYRSQLQQETTPLMPPRFLYDSRVHGASSSSHSAARSSLDSGRSHRPRGFECDYSRTGDCYVPRVNVNDFHANIQEKDETDLYLRSANHNRMDDSDLEDTDEEEDYQGNNDDGQRGPNTPPAQRKKYNLRINPP
ncbi:hypothetical protein PIB30_037698 [Stylosanthes scabra]|uniref:Uncharacterized protein n=1 Tax=Stylosanthes scabra TaxID=79078 RepID=A0ABU6XEM6_9FABA|nr:hypothetical protein [Stylosanthes scabra]